MRTQEDMLMIHAMLVCFPPNSTESEYTLDFALPAAPHPGDVLSIVRDQVRGTEDFLVRRCHWSLQLPASTGQEGPGTLTLLMVECEYALSPASTPEHRHLCLHYAAQTGVLHRIGPQSLHDA